MNVSRQMHMQFHTVLLLNISTGKNTPFHHMPLVLIINITIKSCTYTKTVDLALTCQRLCSLSCEGMPVSGCDHHQRKLQWQWAAASTDVCGLHECHHRQTYYTCTPQGQWTIRDEPNTLVKFLL